MSVEGKGKYHNDKLFDKLFYVVSFSAPMTVLVTFYVLTGIYTDLTLLIILSPLPDTVINVITRAGSITTVDRLFPCFTGNTKIRTSKYKLGEAVDMFDHLESEYN